jgi:hypothetical protein
LTTHEALDHDLTPSSQVEPTRVKDMFDFIEGWKITEAVEYFKIVGVKPFQ